MRKERGAMKVLTRLPKRTDADVQRTWMTNEEKTHNSIANKHSKLYCDKKCPAGAPGMATWRDEGGV